MPSGDCLQVSPAHMALVRSYSSPVLLGPPVCDELVSLVQHMYTAEEADILQHLRPMRARKASTLAKACGRPVGEVGRVLDDLAYGKFLILAVGHGAHARYSLMPIVPGTFEAVFMRPSADSVTEWHRKFAELYEALFDTGYLMDYQAKRFLPVRYIPVGEVIDAIPMALPSDRLEDILDGYDSYAIAVCQCRLSKQLVGEGCGKMLETCTAFGEIGKRLVSLGKARSASKRDVLETKAQAESEGMVTWMFNVGNASRLNGSCSCCGCCCGALRSITQFNMPGSIAPPHFMPRFDTASCVTCEKCSKICPVQAVVIEGEADSRRLVHKAERCIGCGLCAVACSKSSITMLEAPGYKAPSATWPRFAVKTVPEQVNIIRRVSAKRRQP